ncbi:MAG: hypothetical protein ACJA2S_001706 [Cyclobacteriaceae bacterium]|jgi:hypothetical protein
MNTRIKVLYSNTGIYFLFQCEDVQLNATITEDNKQLWKEDVVEIFLWLDESEENYFEYELSPLNYELPLLIMNMDGKPHRWQPWFYEDKRNISHKTSAIGGPKESGSNIKKWIAEFYIPYELLAPIKKNTPNSGTKWRSNFYRMDYSYGKETYWSWQKVRTNFHDLDSFGTLLFD